MILTSALAEAPVAFEAFNVCVVAVCAVVGVPEITQVVALTERPAGRAAVAGQAVTADPLADRVLGVIDIAVPTLPVVPVLEA